MIDFDLRVGNVGYKADLLDYVDPLAMPFHGAYVFTQQGTPDKPIVIKAAGDGEAIFDGAGAYRLFDVMAADYHYFEGLTIRNTDIAFYAGLKGVKGCKGLTVKHCNMDDIGIGVMTHSAESEDFYLADNLLRGRHDPDTLHGWYGFDEPAPLTSYYAIKVYGRGHVICHNDIAYFHDGICVDTHGLPSPLPEQSCSSIDIYRNTLFNMSDDFIEADGGVHNIRVYENRGFNAYHAGLSAQPVFGGPVYFIRNICYQVPGTTLKFKIRPAGLLVYHNTFCTDTSMPEFSNAHFRNNLFMGPNDQRPALQGTNLTTYSSLDYNGYRLKAGITNFHWRSPSRPAQNHADATEQPLRKVQDLQAFRRQTGLEANGIALDYDSFVQVERPDPGKKGHVYPVEGQDFRLKAGSPAVDAGARLPNLNDDFTGQAPDLGAYERGQQPPHYGPRPR